METSANYCKECNRLPGFCICGAADTEPEPEITTEDVLNRAFEQMTLFEKRLDAQEELIANMMIAYSQITATLEVLVSEVMAPRSEEEKKEFKAEMKQRHLDLIMFIKESTNGVERSGPDLRAAVENMVQSDDAPTSEP